MKKSKVYKQWELPNGSRVILPDGKEVIFEKMDGMYGHWNVNGDLAIGNFTEGFIKKENYFVVNNE